MAEPAPVAAAPLTGEREKKKTIQDRSLQQTNKKKATAMKKNYSAIYCYEFLCLLFRPKTFLKVFGSFVEGGAGRARFCREKQKQ